MKLSLLISTYNAPLALEKVLRGVELQNRKPDEVFIADDGSGPETRQVIDAWRSRVRFPVHHVWHEHQGFRKILLLNRAVAAARGEYLVFTDGDCVPHVNFLEDHEALAERGFWVQGRRCFVDERHVPEFEPGRTPVLGWILSRRITGGLKALRLPLPLVFRNTDQRGIIGCNMAFWRDDVVAVNGFDETYIGRGIGPDSDLGTRVYNLGHPRKFVYWRAIVFHLNHPVAPRDNLSEKKIRLEETIRTGRTRCEEGLDKYLARTDNV